ncbi:MAG: hypothetical protein ABR886_10040 [Dehalococcoidales bacterium]|jgi:hypothetical protein
MPDNKPEKQKIRTGFTRDIEAFVKNRAANKKPAQKNVAARKNLGIQLLISELDNLLLHMSAGDTSVLLAREKLDDLKKLIGKTLDIK